MAQMTQQELWNWILSSPYSGMVGAGRNPGSLSLQTGANDGYITSFTAPPGYADNQAALVADPAGFGTPQYSTPSDWTPQISGMEYVPDWQKAIKDANNGGILADSPLAPLMVAGAGMLFGGLGGAGAAGAAEGSGGLSWLGNAGLATPAEAAAGLGAGTASGGAGGLSWLGNSGLASTGEAAAGLNSGYNAGAVMDSVLGATPFNPGAVMDAAAASAGGSSGLFGIPGLTMSALGTGGSLLGTALGGLLGATNGSKQSGTTTTSMEPWKGQQPYLLDAFERARTAANSPLIGQGQSNYMNVLKGPTVNPMLGMDNPYLKGMIDNANSDVTRAMMPAMNQANYASGSFGNSGVADTYSKNLTDAYSRNATNLRFQDYTNQQNLQQQAVNNTLGFTSNANNYAAQPAQNYAQTVQGNYGGTTTTPYYSNPLSGILGGAMVGNKIGSNLGF